MSRAGLKLPGRGHDVIEHGAPAHRVQHFRGAGLHPRALARRKDDDGGRTAHAHSARLLGIAAGTGRGIAPPVHALDLRRIPSGRRRQACMADCRETSPWPGPGCRARHAVSPSTDRAQPAEAAVRRSRCCARRAGHPLRYGRASSQVNAPGRQAAAGQSGGAAATAAAPGRGFEPRFRAPKALVLPIRRPGMVNCPNTLPTTGPGSTWPRDDGPWRTAWRGPAGQPGRARLRRRRADMTTS